MTYTRAASLSVLLAVAIGCGDVHTRWQDCCAPSVVLVEPARIVTSVLYGIGNGAGRVFLTVHVLGAKGEPAPHVLTTITVTGTAAITSSLDLSVTPTDQSLALETDGLGQIQVTVVGRGTVPVGIASGFVGVILVLTVP